MASFSAGVPSLATTHSAVWAAMIAAPAAVLWSSRKDIALFGAAAQDRFMKTPCLGRTLDFFLCDIALRAAAARHRSRKPRLLYRTPDFVAPMFRASAPAAPGVYNRAPRKAVDEARARRQRIKMMLDGCWTDAGQMLDGCWTDAGQMLDG